MAKIQIEDDGTYFQVNEVSLSVPVANVYLSSLLESEAFNDFPAHPGWLSYKAPPTGMEKMFTMFSLSILLIAIKTKSTMLSR